jgi:hypothetical protein
MRIVGQRVQLETMRRKQADQLGELFAIASSQDQRPRHDYTVSGTM